MVEDLDDIRVDKARCGQGLVAEAVDEGWVISKVLCQQLHCDLAFKPLVHRKMDRAHTTRAKAALKLVTPCD
jgi:hypothetical protein